MNKVDEENDKGPNCFKGSRVSHAVASYYSAVRLYFSSNGSLTSICSSWLRPRSPSDISTPWKVSAAATASRNGKILRRPGAAAAAADAFAWLQAEAKSDNFGAIYLNNGMFNS